MDYQIEDWTQETGLLLQDESIGEVCAWDLDGEIIRGEISPTTYHNWYYEKPFDSAVFREYFEALEQKSDEFLSRHGYVRDQRRYRIVESNREQIAIFCHGGFGLTWIAHLLEIPIPIMWSGFVLAPSSVTTILFDERSNQWAVPRCLGLADISHLYEAELPVQPRGIKANFY